MKRGRAFAVEISEHAEDDLVGVAAWYAQRHPAGHERFLRDFRMALDLLRTFPGAGRQRDELRPNLRSQYVHPYLVFYDVDEERRIVSIVRVLHGHLDFDVEDLED